MNLHELTITEAAKKLKSGDITSEELTKACIDRIKKTDKELHAYLATDFDNALKAAKDIDKKRKKGEKLGPLAGIPCSIKDIIVTEGIETTAASNMLRNYIPVFDATSVARLKEAGVIILGKNNLDAWAHGASTENSDFGPTKNPWDTAKVPGGSSGGSAAAVAADSCIFSIGSDTGGSIRQPASYCGVVGLKPTYGRVPRYGSIAMGSSLDCIGPLTKTVEDAALVLQVIAGQDPKDSTTPPEEVPKYTELLGQKISGITIGIVKEAFGDGLDPEVKESVTKAIETLKELGAKVKEISLPHLEYGIASYYIIMPSEVSSNLGRYDGIRYGNVSKEANTLEDVYFKSRAEGFGMEAKRRIMMGTYTLSAGYYDAYYKKAMKVRTLIREDFTKAFDSVDLLVLPTAPTTAFGFGEKEDPLSMYLNDIYTVTANLSGVPGISVPCGFDSKKLPIGLQLLAPQFGEAQLLQVAHAYEQATEWHKEKPSI